MIQEQYQSLKNMYDDLKKNQHLLLTNMDTATNPLHEQDFNEKINQIKLKSSQEMKEAKQELNRQIQDLSSENKELK